MRTKITIMVVTGFILLLLAVDHACAVDRSRFLKEDPYDDPYFVVNRPVNVQGLTGLIMTNSAYTQPKGRIVAGLSAIGENSDTPDFSMAQGIVTVTAGITNRIEFGVRAHVVGTNLGSSATREIGAGDTDLLLKWRVSLQGDLMPALALGLALTLPTGDSTKGLNGVEHEGARIMVIGTSEKVMPGGYFLGLYFEGQFVSNDWSTRTDAGPQADKYGVFNAGLLFPLTDNRRLQAVLEYNTIFKKDIPTVDAENHDAVMPGLRYVTEKFNVSLGVQFYHREFAGASSDQRYLGTISYAF